jgi:hypothetical protein
MSKPIIRPTRREVLGTAISVYADKLRNKARDLSAQESELRQQADVLRRKKDKRIIDHVRNDSATEIDTLRMAVEPLGGQVKETLTKEFFEYSVSLTVRKNIIDPPDCSDLEEEMGELHDRATSFGRESRRLLDEARHMENDKVFRIIVSELGEEAADLLDKLGVMIGEALTPKVKNESN